jgi:hypothetical protein
VHGPFRIEGALGEPRQWVTDLLDLKTRQVCVPCNNGWMNDLEEAARPWLKLMVRGLAARLTPGAQESLARWVFKTAVMVQYLQSPPRPADPQRLQWVSAGGQPPRDAWVILARYAGDDIAAWSHHRTVSAANLLVRQQIPIHGEMTTFCFGHLVIQTLVRTGRHTFSPIIPSLALKQIVPIWPPTGVDQEWPPIVSLTDIGFVQFCDNFSERSPLRIFVPEEQ